MRLPSRGSTATGKTTAVFILFRSPSQWNVKTNLRSIRSTMNAPWKSVAPLSVWKLISPLRVYRQRVGLLMEWLVYQDAGCTVCYESVIVGHNYRNVEEARFEFLKLLWNSWPHPCHLFLPLIIMHKHHHLKPISSNDLFPWLLIDTTVLVGTCSMDGNGKKTT